MKTRQELAKLFQEKKLKNKGVEVGSFKGEYAKEILSCWDGKLYLVDVWRELDIKEYHDLTNQVNYKSIMADCFDNIKDNEDRCFMIRAKSEHAVDLFEDESLDFVYIDANHKYDAIKQDIELWFPKVRKGGIVSGHDYLKMDWYNDPNFAENKKDKYIWMNSENNLNDFNTFAGIFGVNPAIDEFTKKWNYSISLTEEWFGSWYFIK
jgi:hypothetical protein